MLWRADEHEELTERRWDETRARAALREIVADAEQACADGFWPGHHRDDTAHDPGLCTLYLGSAGTIWALLELGSSLDGTDLIGAVIERYRGSPDFGPQAHAPSLWMGETGLLVVARRVGSALADLDRLRELVVENRGRPTWEQVERERDRGGRYTLWTGDIGVALYLRACLDGDPTFPTMDWL